MTLVAFNGLAEQQARAELLRCCGSRRWAERMAALRPFTHEETLFAEASRIWRALDREDWLEAFSHHPRIGAKLEERESSWEAQEQSGTAHAAAETLRRLAQRNQEYESRFGHVYLVCATGKSAEEMLAILDSRLKNDPEAELRTAAEEQAKITRIRLEKLLS